MLPSALWAAFEKCGAVRVAGVKQELLAMIDATGVLANPDEQQCRPAAASKNAAACLLVCYRPLAFGPVLGLALAHDDQLLVLSFFVYPHASRMRRD